MGEEAKPIIKAAKAAIMKKIAAHGRCEMCGADHWSMINGLSTPSEIVTDDKGGLTINLARGWPLAGLICDNCGNAKFFSLEKLGIDPADYPDAGSSK